MHNSPPAEIGSQRDRGMRRQNDRPMEAAPVVSHIRSTHDLRAVQRPGDNPHCLLSIVSAVPQAVPCCREELQLAEPFIDALRRLIAQQPENRDHKGEAQHQPHDGRYHDKNKRLVPAFNNDDVKPRTHDRGAGITADQGMRRRRRQRPPPCQQVPDNRPKQPANHHVLRHRIDLHHALADRLRDRRTQEKRCYKVEESRPYYGQLGG